LFDEQDLKMIDDKSDSDEQIDDDIQDPYLKIKLQANLVLRNLFKNNQQTVLHLFPSFMFKL
jgi:hypothetical protein